MLKRRSGGEFQLVVLGYQHPDVHEDRWESNWLLVNGTVSDDRGRTWRFSAPCVTTFELEDLAGWLEELAADGRQPSTFEFAEPNLRFGYTPWPRALQLTVSDLPPAEPGEPPAQTTLDFPLAETDVVEAAAQIRDALIDYPVRGGAA